MLSDLFLRFLKIRFRNSPPTPGPKTSGLGGTGRPLRNEPLFQRELGSLRLVRQCWQDEKMGHVLQVVCLFREVGGGICEFYFSILST